MIDPKDCTKCVHFKPTYTKRHKCRRYPKEVTVRVPHYCGEFDDGQPLGTATSIDVASVDVTGDGLVASGVLSPVGVEAFRASQRYRRMS